MSYFLYEMSQQPADLGVVILPARTVDAFGRILLGELATGRSLVMGLVRPFLHVEDTCRCFALRSNTLLADD